ncbi:hypothetical protein OPT61_g1813 [Boeremia exigua]|uniref:Uncharacterized protein n=1 Tax=Boeremia exigua TaxID=749465 RepID=A0ACC2INV3_9PLEO|nr:hypothetical protein OPT61_g1813 [Boeremia exigua]
MAFQKGSSLLLALSTLANAYTPTQDFSRDHAGALEKAQTFVSQLNRTEKINMITGAVGLQYGGCVGSIRGVPRLNFTGICMQDGPQVLNRADLVSVFPSGILAGATWDEDLMFARGQAMGEEFRGKGSHVHLGPVAGALGRNALGGRNWEGFSPDPFLAGRAMRATVDGIQSVGVQACSKHFIGNEQETQRTNSFLPNGTEIFAISSNIDDRTLHELYLWPFADAVRAGTAGVMCSYNRLNQTYACENDSLLNGILRKELGFKGYVVSDWFATHSGAKSINAGLDINMPGLLDETDVRSPNPRSYWGLTNVTKMLDDGVVSESRIDEMVQRIMLPYYQLKQDQDFPSLDPSLLLSYGAQYGQRFQVPILPSRDVRADHGQLIRKMGAQGIVLLKNTNNTLPLMSPKNIGLFGSDAAPAVDGLLFGHDANPIGTLDIGGGSGTGRHTYLVSPFEAITAKAKETKARVQYIMNNKILAANDFTSIYPIPDVCLVFLNTFASEGRDRTSYEADWNSTLAVNNVARLCTNTVVVTHSAGINTMPWAHNPNVTAILAAHLPGQESGNSIVDVLWGAENPSGRLPYSISESQSDYDIPIVNLTESEVTSPGAWQADFTERQLIDYRHFDAFNVTPLYEFGFGMGYTSFAVEGALGCQSLTGNITATPAADAEVLPGGNVELWEPVLRLNATVKNTGAIVGATVAQLYMSFPATTVPEDTPKQVLRGFSKILLQPGENGVATFELLRRDVSFWDVESQNWVIPAGAFEFKLLVASTLLVATGFAALPRRPFASSLLTTPGPHDVMQLTAELDRHTSKTSGGVCFGPRFINFLYGVQQFAALGDVAVGGSVWALVRMSLLSIMNLSAYIDKLSSLFMNVGRSAPRHEETALLYPRSTKLQSYLNEYFIVVVDLCRYLFKFGQKSVLQQVAFSLSNMRLKTFQMDLDEWASLIKEQMVMTLTRGDSASASHRQEHATNMRVLDFCSTYDYETAWKQIRKAGNTSSHMQELEYQEWRDGSGPGTLLYTGKLSSGKSVLMANIVDDLSLCAKKEGSQVAYFFCKHDTVESLQARTVIGSLARQLLRTVPDLSVLAKSCEDAHTMGDTEEILEVLLQGFLSDAKAYFVLDGLDECNSKEKETVVQALRKIQEKRRILVCSSFREEPNNSLQLITDQLFNTRLVCIPAENPAIEAFIRTELERCLHQEYLTIGDPTLVLDIHDALLKGSQGMFLWVALQIQSLCSMKTDHAIREALADVPRDLSETFARILQKSGSSDPALQARTLQLVLAACRPLTTGELREALSVIPGDAT